MKTSLSLIVSAGLIFVGSNFSALNAAVYQEVGGRVAIEAEHFDSRTAETGGAQHHWTIIPTEDPGVNLANAGQPFANARGDKYLQVLPDAGINQNTGPEVVDLNPHADYE